MKKTISAFSMLLLGAAAANAQAVLGYTLAETTQTYAPLSDATVIYQSPIEESDNYDRGVITPDGLTTDGDAAKGFDLGFTLNFAGRSYTSFLVSTSGYLYLGNGEEIEYNTMMRNNYLTYYGEDFALVGLACSMGVGYNENTVISYTTTGSGDDAALTVQYENFAVNATMWDETPQPIDFQLTVTADGKVSIAFANLANDNDREEYSFRIGVRQGSEYVCAYGTYGEVTESYGSVEDCVIPSSLADGSAIVWNVPADCVTPTAQPTDAIFERTSDSLSYSFSPADDADTYLVVYSIGDAKAGVPVDGTVYQAGEELGEGIVAYYGPALKVKGDVYSLDPGTEYTFRFYSVGAYGLNGPKYNTNDPLTVEVATLPKSPGDVSFSGYALDSITLNVDDNGTDDDILVIYNSYCEHSNFGDHGLFGELTPDTKAGDVLPVPEGFTPTYNYEGAPMPENAGTVAYVGKPGEVTITDLNPSTMYYVSVYTRNAAGEYTSKPVNTGWSTILTLPYDGDSFNFPNYRVPYGWESSEAGDGTLQVTDEAYYDRSDMTPTRGTQIVQQRVIVSRGNATTGMKGWITPALVEVSERHQTVNFSYSIVEATSRFASNPYNDWAEEDVLQIQVSTDNGESWNVLTSYTAENHPEQEELTSYNTISADLNDYRGQQVLVRLYWDTYMAPAFGGNMYVERFTVEQAEFPAVPEVSVGAVTDETAVINWVSQQTDYQLAYSLKDSEEENLVDVDGNMTYTIEGLEANTEYVVRVRGKLVSEDSEEIEFTEWSDPVEFTTADYPAVDAPEGLVSDVETKGDDRIAILSWTAIEVAEKYEVAYRLSSSTEWIYIETEETSVEIEDLEYDETYVWKVRAFCTHDRETPYSAQARFTMPEDSNAGIEDVVTAISVSAENGILTVKGCEGKALKVVNTAGVCFVSKNNAEPEENLSLQPGAYIVNVDNAVVKVLVK
ncbi:MAG: fibronectin type III domain-containing protein [Bacteroides sp.]|nr:fibronectin type III domain-containing protein [Bacteroides sp.]